MRLQIKEIILWPRKSEIEPKRVIFEEESVNVITGASKTGKSSVISVIDYCLGSDRCSIPVETIRKACSWFGVLLLVDGGQLLIARKEPGEQQSTGDLFVIEGQEIEIPNSIEAKNSNVDAMKNRLNELAGLSNLGFETDNANGFKSRPSFRDLMAFCFQPQNLIANPDVLFFKADTFEHREKLKTIFPYVLGALDASVLAKKVEYEFLLKQLRQKEKELKLQSEASMSFISELQAWVSDAISLGLVSDTKISQEQGELLKLLERVSKRSSRDIDLQVSNVEAMAREAVELDISEGEITLELGKLRRRLDGMQKLRSSVDEYTGALIKQRDRLSVSLWLKDLAVTNKECPICNGPLDEAHHDLEELCDALALVEASTREAKSVPVSFSQELQEVKVKLGQFTERLQSVRYRKRALEQNSKEILQSGLKSSQVDRFLGKLEQALSSYRKSEHENTIASDIEDLKEQLEDLKTGIDTVGIKKKQEYALTQFTKYVAEVLSDLDCERPEDPVHLDIQELTLQVASKDGRKDYLWEIGSGANWLAYHIATFIALHRFFASLRHTPVPGLLVIDQPSQVYFPRKLARKDDDKELESELNDEDTQAIRKVFEQLGKFVNNSKGKMQIIVLDHAGPEVWGRIAGVTLADEWRDGKKLIPDFWIQE